MLQFFVLTLFVLLLVSTLISIIFYVLQSSVKQNLKNNLNQVRKSKTATPRGVIRKHRPIRQPKYGSCSCPYDRDKAGRICGKRSAYSRPNGRSPICYTDD